MGTEKELQEKLDQANEALAASEKSNEEKTAELQEAKDRIKELEAAAGDESELKKENESLKGNIEALNKVIATAGSAEASGEKNSLTHKKKTYLVNVKAFRLPGDTTVYAAADLAKDKELVEKILAINGQSVLVEED